MQHVVLYAWASADVTLIYALKCHMGAGGFKMQSKWVEIAHFYSALSRIRKFYFLKSDWISGSGISCKLRVCGFRRFNNQSSSNLRRVCCSIHLFVFQMWMVSSSTLCFRACSSRKSKKYLTAGGTTAPVQRTLRKKSSTNCCSVPWKSQHEYLSGTAEMHLGKQFMDGKSDSRQTLALRHSS